MQNTSCSPRACSPLRSASTATFPAARDPCTRGLHGCHLPLIRGGGVGPGLALIVRHFFDGLGMETCGATRLTELHARPISLMIRKTSLRIRDGMRILG